MIRLNRQKTKGFISRKAQSAVEYLLLFAIVIVILLLALKPGGFLSNSINQAVDLSVQGLEIMANNATF